MKPVLNQKENLRGRPKKPGCPHFEWRVAKTSHFHARWFVRTKGGNSCSYRVESRCTKCNKKSVIYQWADETNPFKTIHTKSEKAVLAAIGGFHSHNYEPAKI